MQVISLMVMIPLLSFTIDIESIKLNGQLFFPSSTVDYQIAIGAVNHGAITASLDACAEQPGTITKWVCDGGELLLSVVL